MATFPNIQPSLPLVKREQPNVRTTKLGDGYENRVIFGLPTQQNPNVLNLTFKNITHANAKTIDAFLKSQSLLGASFNFTPPLEGSSVKSSIAVSILNNSDIATVTSNNHGIALNDFIEITASNNTTRLALGNYLVKTYTDTNTFKIKTSTNSTGSTVNVVISYLSSGLGKYVCDQWNVNTNYSNTATVQAQFRQVFEP